MARQLQYRAAMGALDQTIRDTPKYDGAFVAGDILNDTYELRDILGTGGMGQVWDAYDRKLGRSVAIKVSWPHAPQALLSEEARAMAQLHHPCLPAVHSLAKHEEIEYIVMERLFGRTLFDHLKARTEHAFSADEAVDILIGIADALSAIHRSGFVHRDLKTDNIMLAPQGRVVLLDFGVMQSFETAAMNQQVYGSPHYVAPEVVMLQVRAADAHLLDVYSMGAIAYELLTGEPPYNATSIAELLMLHVRAPVPSLKDHEDIPIELARLIESMLAKRPEDRPYNLDIVATSLRTIRRGRHQQSHSAPLSVIIADDDPDIRLLLEACVENAVPGAEIRLASDGHSALNQFLEHPPHVMLLDLRMPGMNGIELCMHLRGTSLAAETAIFAVSAHATESDREVLERLGVVECVNKRVDIEELISKLVGLIRGIQQTRNHIHDF